MVQVSIVVPVYNTPETALRRCIDSVLKQEYADFELILTDDGSVKNNAAEVLDEYAAKDSRVVVIHKPNGGVSSARNAAFKVMKGTYVQFMDSDDWIPDDSTKNLVRCAQETDADLVVGQFYRVVGENLSVKGSIRTGQKMTLQEYAGYMMESPADYYYGVLWNKLYKREIIQKYSMCMDESISWCEDFVFNLEYLLHVSSVYSLQLPVYYYVKTEGSLVSQNLSLSKTVQMKKDMFFYYNDFYKQILDEKEYRSQALNIAGFFVTAAMDDPVIPLLPSTKKVGEEIVRAEFRSDNDNPVIAAYYTGKLYEKYLNVVAMKHDLDRKDVKIAAALKEAGDNISVKALSEYTELSAVTVYSVLEKLMRRGYARLSLEDGLSVHLTEGSKELQADLDQAMEDLCTASFRGMSEEEKALWLNLTGKIMNNLRESIGTEE